MNELETSTPEKDSKIPRVEIQYLIHEYETVQQEAFEKILAATGAYEIELEAKEIRSAPDIEFRYVGETSVIIVLSRNIHDRRYLAQALHDTDVLREGVERHLPEADRSRLSAHFFGIDIPKGLETE